MGWIIVVILVSIGAAVLVSWSQTPVYRSTASVLVQPRVYSAGTAPQPPDMGTEKTVASSGAVLQRASRVLGVPVGELSHGLSVGVPLNTNVLRISYNSKDPKQAQRRAQAVAEAYTQYSQAQQPSSRTSPRTAAGAPIGNAVITNAALPTTPASPNHVVDLVIAAVIGLMVALGTAFVRDRFDDRLRWPQEFEEIGAGPVLAVIPALLRRRSNRTALVMVRSPDSAAARAYQDLRTMVFRAAAQRSARTLLVTSPAGDRQTTVAANLAIALAQAGQRVTLVCADMRWPHGHELFGEYNTVGLASVIEGRASLGDALRETAIPGLNVLAAGWLAGDYGAALHGNGLRQAIGRLRGGADFVVIDAPPALAGADTGALAELSEMVLLVGDARRTTRRQASTMVDQLEHVSGRIIGWVVDNFGRRTRPAVAPITLRPVDPGTGEPPNGHGRPDQLRDVIAAEESARRS
jgi:capsular exopolysaccharide synthesis family protein